MEKLRLLNTSEYFTARIVQRVLEGTGFHVVPLLRLNKVIGASASDSLSKAEKRFLNEAELDFVIYNPNSLPEFALEFDGPSHVMYPKSYQADTKKNRLCHMAKLPLLRVSDVHLKEYEKTSLLEYMVTRFVAWRREENAIIKEINDYWDSISEEERSSLQESDTLDPSLDPSAIFDLRHPFPGIEDLAESLFLKYGIRTDHLSPTAHTPGTSNHPVCVFHGVPIRMPSLGSDYYVKSRCELLEFEETSQGKRSGPKQLCTIETEFGLQWTLPMVDDFDWTESPFEYHVKKGRIAIGFQEIPGISIPDLVENFHDFLALRKLKSWADENLRAPAESSLD